MRQAPLDGAQTPAAILLDDLHNVQIGPHAQRRPPALARAYPITEDAQNGALSGGKTVDRPQNRLADPRCGAHVLHHLGD